VSALDPSTPEAGAAVTGKRQQKRTQPTTHQARLRRISQHAAAQPWTTELVRLLNVFKNVPSPDLGTVKEQHCGKVVDAIRGCSSVVAARQDAAIAAGVAAPMVEVLTGVHLGDRETCMHACGALHRRGLHEKRGGRLHSVPWVAKRRWRLSLPSTVIATPRHSTRR
jgi:hypothetical protein